MFFVKINNTEYPAKIDGRLSDHEWGGRESKAITVNMTHKEAVELFSDNVEWCIVQQPDSYIDNDGNMVTPDPTIYDNSEFCISGQIVDHRDGTLTIKMGKLTELEETLEMIYGGTN